MHGFLLCITQAYVLVLQPRNLALHFGYDLLIDRKRRHIQCRVIKLEPNSIDFTLEVLDLLPENHVRVLACMNLLLQLTYLKVFPRELRLELGAAIRNFLIALSEEFDRVVDLMLVFDFDLHFLIELREII